MERTQVWLGDEELRLLDHASQRTGRSISSLIREAVQVVYGSRRSLEDDLAAISSACGAWAPRDRDGAAWVEQRRTGSRLSPEGWPAT